ERAQMARDLSVKPKEGGNTVNCQSECACSLLLRPPRAGTVRKLISAHACMKVEIGCSTGEWHEVPRAEAAS
ncbi:MAG: hypothetical protein KAH24_01520, partial [Holophagae bacterium]|nr:hypothetical protein [Holophagae bacterium]